MKNRRVNKTGMYYMNLVDPETDILLAKLTNIISVFLH